MHDVKACGDHISSILGQMVKKWCDVLPVGVRQLEKFNRTNNNVLIKTGEEKTKILNEMSQAMRLKNFKGMASGQSIDLSVYKKVFEPIGFEASDQKPVRTPKEVI